MADTNTEVTPFDRPLAEALCSLEIPKQVKLSPDGNKLVYVTSLENGVLRKGDRTVSTLWLALTSEPGSARKLTSGTSRDSSPRWHPGGSRVAFLSDRGGSNAIWMLRLDGGDPVQVSPGGGIGAFAFSPTGDEIAYTSSDGRTNEQKEREAKNWGVSGPNVWGDDAHYHSRLRLLNLKTRETRTLDTGKGNVTKFAWSPDAKSLIFATVATMDPEEMYLSGTAVKIIAVDSGATAQLCTSRNGADSLTWAPNGKAYFIDLADPKSILSGMAVYAVDPTASAAAAPELVISGNEDDPGHIIATGGEVLVVRNVREGTLVTTITGRRVFEKAVAFKECDVHHDAASGRWTTAACLSDINTPTEVVVSSDNGQSTRTLSEHGKHFQGRQFGSCHVLSCMSADNKVELDGIYFAPAGQVKPDKDSKPERPLPTAVLLHGGPNDRDLNCFNPLTLYWVTYLLTRGYGVLLPQYRGGFGRGARFAAYNTTGHGRENYSDVITITDHAVQSGFADANKMLIGGWSMGGLLTYLASVRNGRHGLGWHFQAAIAGAGICDMDNLAMTSALGSSALTELGGGRAAWACDKNDTSARNGSALWEVSGAVEEAKTTGNTVIPPMLILHGEQDPVVPFSQAQGFRRALRAHDLPCEFVAYPGQGHTFGPMGYWLDMLERVQRWCATYIGPGVKVAQ